MEVTVELSDDDLKVLKERQLFRMQWIQAGMDDKEPFDLVIQKVVNAAEQKMHPTLLEACGICGRVDDNHLQDKRHLQLPQSG